MNKRIEDLMYHAGLTAAGCWDTMDTYDRAAIKKFAELIVRECGNIAWKHTPDTEDLEYSHLIKDKILEHFGVEE